MELYITPGSSYARMARIIVLEKGLEKRVEIVTAQTRRLEGLARSLLDGIAVWGRELARPENERSPGVIHHEARRGERMADAWETEIGHPLMHGALNRVQLTFVCALGLEARIPTGLRGVSRWVRPLFFRIWASLALVLAFDTLLFVIGGFVEHPAYREILLAGILGKVATAWWKREHGFESAAETQRREEKRDWINWQDRQAEQILVSSSLRRRTSGVPSGELVSAV